MAEEIRGFLLYYGPIALAAGLIWTVVIWWAQRVLAYGEMDALLACSSRH
jgi:hypothetical protein